MFRKDISASIKIIDGEDGVLNVSNSIFTITIVRDSTNKFIVTKTDLSHNTSLVGTGIERTLAVDSGVVVAAKRGGVVDYVDASRIVVKVNER